MTVAIDAFEQACCTTPLGETAAWRTTLIPRHAAQKQGAADSGHGGIKTSTNRSRTQGLWEHYCWLDCNEHTVMLYRLVGKTDRSALGCYRPSWRERNVAALSFPCQAGKRKNARGPPLRGVDRVCTLQDGPFCESTLAALVSASGLHRWTHSQCYEKKKKQLCSEVS